MDSPALLQCVSSCVTKRSHVSFRLSESKSDAGVVPEMSPASTSSHMFPVCSDSVYEQTFSMLQASFLNPDVPPSSCLNPYFASYDQELLPCAFSKRGLSGQDPRAPSHFIPTSSNAVGMSVNQPVQNQQSADSQRPRSAAAYSIPKDVLHVGEDKPMAREARVARCVACLPSAPQCCLFTCSRLASAHCYHAVRPYWLTHARDPVCA